jgi:Short C-terminal domain
MFGKRQQKLLAKMGLDPATLQQAAGRVQALTTAMGPTQTAYRVLVQRVAAGAEMPATLQSISIGEAQPQMGGVSVSLQLVVEPPDGSTYAATADQVLPDAILRTLAEGQRVTVKVAPDDRQCLMLWNTPHAAGGADPDTGRPLAAAGPGASTDDRIGRLEKLGELRDSGVLTEEEFQAQKAKILAR